MDQTIASSSQRQALGEEAVREEFPNSVIIRPADIFGDQDAWAPAYQSPTGIQAFVFQKNCKLNFGQIFHHQDIQVVRIFDIKSSFQQKNAR